MAYTATLDTETHYASNFYSTNNYKFSYHANSTHLCLSSHIIIHNQIAYL